MAGRTFVALDLETTGLDPSRDAIIEVGAVRFRDGAILERLVTFVNPQRTIPPRIQQMTGIRDADVAGAPTFDQVAPELRAFVGADVAAVVAHNAAFDMGFLHAHGLRLHRPALDTHELATIVLPGLASYSLGELCIHLDINLVDAHRALADAEAAAILFGHLNACVGRLPPALLQLLVASAGESDWPPLLLLSDALRAAQGRGTASAWPSRSAPLRENGSGPPAPPHFAPLPTRNSGVPESLLRDSGPLRTSAQGSTTSTSAAGAHAATLAATMAADFGPDGPVARSYGPGYEPRAGQIEMARQVANALEVGDHLIVEAGTGTGKSLAYLLPAARWAVANQRRVVIATNTIPLQDQLLGREIPRVAQILADSGESLRSTVLKGRTNYLCTRRLHLWRTSHRLSPAELSSLARILVWLPSTQTGDMSELALTTQVDRDVWQQICSDAATCSNDRCGAEAGDEWQDYFLIARRRAEQAHLLVVNHALLLADVAREGRVLPAYSHLIVDEAHQLEGAATDQLTYRMEWPWMSGLLQRVGGEGDLTRQIDDAALFGGLPDAQQTVRAVAALADETRRRLRTVHEYLLTFALGMEASSESGYIQRLPLDGRVRSQPDWGEVEIAWELAEAPLRQLVEAANGLATELRTARWDESAAVAPLLDDLTGVTEKLAEFLQRADRMVYATGGIQSTGSVCWIEVNDSRTLAAVAEAPLHVSDMVQRDLVFNRRSAIFTGATLRSGADFRFLRERLGLWDVPAVIVESPFDYRANALLFMPSDLAQPNHATWQSGVERAIIDAADACDGRTLALFTSNSHLRATAETIRGPLEQLGITLLQQGAGSRQRLLRDFRRQERALLLGTRTFWEGIDLPGDELRCLLIVKLPFAVPNDPLVAARSSEFDDPFHEYMLPDAVLRFCQGFGRLIRRASDRGVVVLLDSRIWRKEYGQLFLEALPPCTTRHAPLSLLSSEVRKWLDR
jgi:DNA polymerase-3 subunit epsilon/ATP-dependent DNA helicase DinG